jgi:hypothetical protein
MGFFTAKILVDPKIHLIYNSSYSDKQGAKNEQTHSIHFGNLQTGS